MKKKSGLLCLAGWLVAVTMICSAIAVRAQEGEGEDVSPELPSESVAASDLTRDLPTVDDPTTTPSESAEGDPTTMLPETSEGDPMTTPPETSEGDPTTTPPETSEGDPMTTPLETSECDPTTTPPETSAEELTTTGITTTAPRPSTLAPIIIGSPENSAYYPLSPDIPVSVVTGDNGEIIGTLTAEQVSDNRPQQSSNANDEKDEEDLSEDSEGQSDSDKRNSGNILLTALLFGGAFIGGALLLILLRAKHKQNL